MAPGITFPLPLDRDAFRNVPHRLPVMAVVNRAPRRPLTGSSEGLAGLVVGGGADALVLAELLEATWTDAFVVWHDGRLVHEEYLAGQTAEQPHLVQSVTKSFVGAVIGRLASERALDVAREVQEYVPDLTDTAYATATVRDLLDMRSGVAFACDYDDPTSGWADLSRASGWIQSDPAAGAPEGQRAYLRSLSAAAPHGGPFDYRSSETAVLGWIAEQAGSAPLAALLSELIWTPMGAEAEAFLAVDRLGAPLAERGLCSTARDLVRFAITWLEDGMAAGERVLAADWVKDTSVGDVSSRQAFAGNPARAMLGSSAHYRNQVWVGRIDPPILYFTGIHGQLVVVDVARRLVVVKLSTQPSPSDATMMNQQLALVDAVRRSLVDAA